MHILKDEIVITENFRLTGKTKTLRLIQVGGL